MSATVREFLKGALGLIALFLVVTHSTGFSRSIKGATGGAADVFKTLQGPPGSYN